MPDWWVIHWILADDGETAIPTTDILTWRVWYGSADVVVRQDWLPSPPWPSRSGVSTVFLGMDHRFTADGPPVLWESMVFGTPLDGKCRRYTSRAEALAGHAALLAEVMASLPDDGKAGGT